MHHAAMAPEVFVLYAIGMQSGIEIGPGRARHCQPPEFPGHRAGEACLAAGQRDECMRECGGHER